MRGLARLLAPPVLAATVLAGCGGTNRPETGAGFLFVRLSGPMPRLAGSTLAGGALRPSEYAGKVVLVNFWASWCTPCKSEAAVLERDWTRYRGRGVEFLGVDYHDLAADARRFVSAHALTFTMLQDGSGRVTSIYGISQVPETYVLNRQGRVVAHLAGPITDPSFAGEFRNALAKAAA